jgi:DNA-binding GntR family transcriptional regulator
MSIIYIIINLRFSIPKTAAGIRTTIARETVTELPMSINVSLTEGIYERIREDLMICRLAPGNRLKTKDLSVSLGVSLGVVREALSRLTAEGLVLAEPQRGFRAAPISADELMQLSEATIAIEGICLRRSIATGDLEWETAVTAAHYRLLNIPMYDSDNCLHISKKFTAAYAEFRRALLAACDNAWLLRLRDTLHAQTERYRQVCMVAAPKKLDFRDGYAAIVAAALKRDVDQAVNLLTERLSTNAQLMRSALLKSAVPGAATRRPRAPAKRRLRKAQ